MTTFEIQKRGEAPKRITMILWGAAGVGKTTFAATAPGTKLWLSLGDNEHISVADREDVEVMPLYRYKYGDVVEDGKTTNPFNLDRILAERDYIDTVVFDSLTALSDISLRCAVDARLGQSKGFTPSMEHPGMTAYGGRNATTLTIMNRLLNVTAKHGVHLIMTAHEADPEKDDDGIIQYFSIMLGGKLVNNISWRFSEFWYMSEDAKGRQLAVRPTRKRKPMKSRMFKGIGEPEFILNYDANEPDGGQMTIASFFEKWSANGSKLPIPPSRRDK